MDTTHYLDDDGDAMMDTKEEFVVCAFIGNAVESTSVDLVLRDYCEFAIETNGGSDDDDDSEVEAHLTGYYVPEYDEDEDAARERRDRSRGGARRPGTNHGATKQRAGASARRRATIPTRTEAAAEQETAPDEAPASTPCISPSSRCSLCEVFCVYPPSAYGRRSPLN